MLLDVAVARENLPNHPYVLFANLFARVFAAEIYRVAGKPAKVEQLLEEARRDAPALDAFVRLPDPAYGLWTYWNYIHEERKVLELLVPAADGKAVPTFAYMASMSLFRESETAKAAALLGKTKNSGSADLEVLRAMMAAEMSSNSADGIAIYDVAMKQYLARDDLMEFQQALTILGQPQRAIERSREIRRSMPSSTIWRPFYEPWEKYLCAELSDEEFIRLAKDSRWDQRSAFYNIALRRLGEGDRKKAREAAPRLNSRGAKAGAVGKRA